MYESETRVEYIDPKLKASVWGEVEGLKKPARNSKRKKQKPPRIFLK